MTEKFQTRASVSSCETKKEDAKPALVPKLGFTSIRRFSIPEMY